MAKNKGLIAEFKQFISKGSVLDLAVGIIIGTAFTAIVNSLVKDIIMPFVGWVLGGVNFTELRIVIRQATAETAELALTYGNFIQRLVDFLIISFVVFMIVRTFNKFRELREKQMAAEEAAKPAPTPVTPQDIVLLTEIRDLLQKK